MTIKFHNAMTVPALMYANESWIIIEKDINKAQAAEMRFLRMVKHCMRRDLI